MARAPVGRFPYLHSLCYMANLYLFADIYWLEFCNQVFDVVESYYKTGYIPGCRGIILDYCYSCADTISRI